MGLLNFFKKGDDKSPEKPKPGTQSKGPTEPKTKHTSNPDIHLEKPPEPTGNRNRKHLPNVPQLGITPIPELSAPIMPSSSATAPIPEQAAAPAAPPPTPAPVSAQSVTPGNAPSMMAATVANEPSIVNNMLRIPTPMLLSALPDNCRNPEWESHLSKCPAYIEFAQHDVLPILRQGAFRVTAGPLAGMLSAELVSSYALTSQEVVELPLLEFLNIIPTSWFEIPNQSLHLDEVLTATIDPFEITSLKPQEATLPETPVAETPTPSVKAPEPAPTLLQNSNTSSSENTKTQEMAVPSTPDFLTATLPGQDNLKTTDPLTKTLPAMDDPQEEIQLDVQETITATKVDLISGDTFDAQETLVSTKVQLSKSEILSKTPHRDVTDLNMLKGVALPKTPAMNAPIDTQETMVAPAKELKKSSLDTDAAPISVDGDTLTLQAVFILKQLPRELAAASQKNLNTPLKLDKYEVLDHLKTGHFRIPFKTLSCYLAPPPGTVKLDHLEVPLTTILPHIPLSWFDLGNQSMQHEETLKNIHDVFELPEIEAAVAAEPTVHEEIISETKPVQPESTAPSSSSAMDLISGSSAILGFSDDAEEEEATVTEKSEESVIEPIITEDDETPAPIVDEEEEVISPVVEEEEISQAPILEEVKITPLVEEAEVIQPIVDESEDIFTPVVEEDDELSATNTHRPPPRAEDILKSEFDLDRNLVLEGKDNPLEPGILDTQCLTRRTVKDLSKTAFEFVDSDQVETPTKEKPKAPSVAQPDSAEKDYSQPSTSTAPPLAPSQAMPKVDPTPVASTPSTPSIAPNGIQLNTCSKADLLLIENCSDELADKVIFNRGDSYASVEDLLKVETINENDYAILTGLNAKQSLAAKEASFFDFADQAGDSPLNKMANALLEKCSLHSLILSSLDGIEICNCGDTTFLNSTPEKLAAAIPSLLSVQKDFISHSQLPNPNAFTFYIDGHAATVAQAGEMYFTAIHKEKYPSIEHMQTVETAQSLVAWYCSTRIVL